MELASETKTFAAYSPTSTPILDVLRPVPNSGLEKVSAGEYFFLSSGFILILIYLPELRHLLAQASTGSRGILNIFVFAPVAAMAGAVLVHELGHLIAARLGGFRLVRLRWGFSHEESCSADRRLHFCEVLPVGGIMLAPRKLRQLKRSLMCLFAAGPITSVGFAVLLEACPAWDAVGPALAVGVHLTAIFSALMGTAALLPDSTRSGNFSDGARLLMLVRNDERGRRWLAILEMQLALEHGINPRDWDPLRISEAAAASDDTRDHVTGCWLAYLAAAERQDITSATRFLEEALAAPAASSAWVRDRLFVEAAVFQAWYRDNPGKARSWVAMIHERKLDELQKLRLKSALLWADGKLFDAWEQTAAYLKAVQQLSQSPGRDLAEKSTQEWRRQMESRMLTRAWRSMYSLSQEVELTTVPAQNAV
ncbi:MAG TPA: M50 family metallopeptidase [Candidatus Limnocylindrales bacterium]|jgi:hypothetical protein|nr:M50 family metallopeptidase [Candidatus Limnocylindrales bacterium]